MRQLLAGAMGAVVVVLVWGGFGLMPGRAEAQVTWRVQNYGVDSPTCGTVAAPCRSITQAITNANAGDIVSVGPGRYGDLDGDGNLGNLPGEEVATACRLPGFCLLSVNKRLTIRSTQGAGATVLDAGGANLPDGGVLIRADGVVFGQQDAGFTITGLTNGFAGIAVGFVFLGGPSNVRVGGNRVAENDLFDGISLFETTGSKVVGNLVSGKQTRNGVSALRSTGAAVTSNVAIGLAQFGFSFEDSGVVATGNAAIGNRFAGFELSLGEIDPGVPAPPTTLNRNTAAGNLGPGIRIFGTPSTNPVTLSQNNIYGNHTTVTDENCGLVNATEAAINATDNFWGAASGPGHDPADDICDFGASTTTFVPFATVPFPIPIGLAGK